MGPGHGEDPLVDEHVLGEPLRAGVVGQPAVEQRLDHREAARHRVADDVEVGAVAIELGRVVALVQLDAERAQLVAHRRVDLGVAAGHFVAELARDPGEPAHEGAADAEDVQVHPTPAAG